MVRKINGPTAIGACRFLQENDTSEKAAAEGKWEETIVFSVCWKPVSPNELGATEFSVACAAAFVNEEFR